MFGGDITCKFFIRDFLVHRCFLQEASEIPFDISTVPKDVLPQAFMEKNTHGLKKPSQDLGLTNNAPITASKAVDTYEKLLSSIPEFAGFGKLFKVMSCLVQREQMFGMIFPDISLFF